MATFYGGMRNYIAALNNLAAIAGLDSFSFSLANADAVSWADASTTDIHDCLELDASNNFNVGPQTAPGSNGHLALWAAGAEKVRVLATGALLVGATSAIAGEAVLANVAAITPVSNTVVGVLANGAGQATATTSIRGFESRATTAASAFTATELSHFKATGAAAGAGSTITSLYGVKVDNAAAVGTNNYAFWTDFASASNKWGIYASGTAQHYFGGPIGILGSTPLTAGALLHLSGTHPATGTTVYGVLGAVTGPSSATAAINAFASTSTTAAAAFTVTSLNHFHAVGAAKGAGSTITTVRGFYAANAIAVASNNYGFYSDINSASNTYQLYMVGTALSYFGGQVGINATPVVHRALTVGAATPAAGDLYGVAAIISAPSSVAGLLCGSYSNLSSAAAAFTMGSMTHFLAAISNKGAGSTITVVHGFRAANAIAVGTNNYGFYSDIASAANTYQLYMAGTALNLLKGGLILDTTAAPTVGAGQVGLGATVQTTVGAAGGASALPATPTGYLIINVAGTNRVVPYYAAS